MLGIVAHIYFITAGWIIRYSKRIIGKPNIAKPTYIFWIFSFGFCRIAFAQTSIVMTADYGSIYIGADSRIKNTIIETKIVKLDSLCKIIKFGDFFFAAAGTIKSNKLDYDFQKIAQSVFNYETKLENIVQRIEIEIMIPLKKIAELAKKNDIKRFERYKSAKGIIQFVIFRIKNNQPIICARTYRVKDNFGKGVEIVFDKNNSHTINEPIPYITMGSDKIIKRIFSMDKNYIKFDTINRIRQLIEMEIAANTDSTVGGPINILWVHGDSFEWINPKPPCPTEK